MNNFDWLLCEIIKEYREFGNPLEKAYLTLVDYDIKKSKPLFETNQHSIDKTKVERLVYQYIVKEFNDKETEKLWEALENGEDANN